MLKMDFSFCAWKLGFVKSSHNFEPLPDHVLTAGFSGLKCQPCDLLR